MIATQPLKVSVVDGDLIEFTKPDGMEIYVL